MNLLWRDVKLTDDGPAIATSITQRETTELAKLSAGKLCLEIGAAYGYSACVMALMGAHVTSVDPHDWLHSELVLRANVAAYRVTSMVSVIVDRDTAVLPLMMDNMYDFVFVDGDHRETALRFDIDQAKRVVKPGGTIACHDYHESSCPAVETVLDSLYRKPDKLVDTLYVIQC